MEKFQSRERKHHYFVISNPLNTFRPYLSVHVSSFASNIIAPWVYTKTSNLSMQGILVLTSAYARTSVRTDSWGGGRGVPRQPNGEEENTIFSWREIARCFGATSGIFLG